MVPKRSIDYGFFNSFFYKQQGVVPWICFLIQTEIHSTQYLHKIKIQNRKLRDRISFLELTLDFFLCYPPSPRLRRHAVGRKLPCHLYNLLSPYQAEVKFGIFRYDMNIYIV